MPGKLTVKNFPPGTGPHAAPLPLHTGVLVNNYSGHGGIVVVVSKNDDISTDGKLKEEIATITAWNRVFLSIPEGKDTARITIWAVRDGTLPDVRGNGWNRFLERSPEMCRVLTHTPIRDGERIDIESDSDSDSSDDQGHRTWLGMAKPQKPVSTSASTPRPQSRGGFKNRIRVVNELVADAIVATCYKARDETFINHFEFKLEGSPTGGGIGGGIDRTKDTPASMEFRRIPPADANSASTATFQMSWFAGERRIMIFKVLPQEGRAEMKELIIDKSGNLGGHFKGLVTGLELIHQRVVKGSCEITVTKSGAIRED